MTGLGAAWVRVKAVSQTGKNGKILKWLALCQFLTFFHQETYLEFQIHYRMFVAMAQIQKTNIKKK